MTAKELKRKYIGFFVKRGHKEVPSASLVPENDPTALFISAGMHPLVPYLLGEPHPMGKRLVNVQKCLRVNDVEKVGDSFHHTFLEMLGNWSLGDYWKKEAIKWSYQFLIQELNLEPKRLSVTCFTGDKDAPRDEESAKIWLSLGIPKERIYFLGKKDNWWGPVGETGPCGPDTEIFYDTGKKSCSTNCQPGCSCGKYFEIWNNVFMEYEKKVKSQSRSKFGTKVKSQEKDQEKEYQYLPLEQKNVDTGMGVERTVAILQGKDDDYQTELFTSIIQIIEELSGKRYLASNPSCSAHDRGSNKKDFEFESVRAFRIIADHLRAATFAITDGVLPSNKDRGYVVRRLIRRSVVQMMQLNIIVFRKIIPEICQQIIDIYKEPYFAEINSYEIHPIISAEIDNFLPKMHRAGKLLQTKPISGKLLFDLFQTHGLPFEVAQDLLKQWGQKIDKKIKEEYNQEFKKHQQMSREGAKKKFKSGLANHSEAVIKLHTATHLLHQALRKILGSEVKQAGSNITAERLRFDFTYSRQLTQEEINQVEKLVNEKIKENLPATWQIVSLESARKAGALAFFNQKYGEKVKVYSIGRFSKEVCAGPHVGFTSELGKFKIIKEESAGSGVRRIYGILE